VETADPSAQSRTQGGQLDIHEGAEAMRILDPNGKVLFDQPDDGTSHRPEVLRGDLRRILLDSLPDQSVQWGRKVTGVLPLGQGRHELTFTDGASVTCDLLVGADGTWSKIRPLLSDAKPGTPARRSSRPISTTPTGGTPRRSAPARCTR
jgi:2-polyprenyl-6-methoxyphenol hydroxylase-like FAD-dependent oxidoreductase